MITLLLHQPVFFLMIVLIIICSICVHELAHGFAALHQGDDTPIRSGHMDLNPVVLMGWESLIFLCITGMAWGAMPVNPRKFRSAKWGEVIVAGAGPLSNLALAVLSIILFKLSHSLSSIGTQDFSSLAFVLLLAALLNLKLFFLNMLPIPPLDGHIVFSEFFPELKPLKDSPFGLAALMILFLSPFGEGLDLLAGWFISLTAGVPLEAIVQL